MIQSFSKMNEIEINKIKPQGWLKTFLEKQREGLTGHLEVAGYPFDTVSWAEPNANNERERNPRWWPYEQNGYWVDAMERCGKLLDDDFLLEKADKSLDYILNNPDEDGYLGPCFMKDKGIPQIRWSHTVIFRALMAKYSENDGSDILKKLTNHYLNSPFEYSDGRDVTNIEIMLWVYLKTGNKELLELAEKTYKIYNTKALLAERGKPGDFVCDQLMNIKNKPFVHGVTYNEFFKLGAILYICTGNKKYLKTTKTAYNKVDKYFMLVDGLHCSEEETYDNNYMRTHEACDISDYTWGVGYLLMATGDGKWADRIERCVFNAGIGQVTEDFKAAQYFSCPNQLVLAKNSNHALYHRGILPAMCYRPKPMTECCPANVSRFMPNYCARMWMQKGKDIFAVLYGASQASFDGVVINENTEYPFDDRIKFTFSMKKRKKIRFNLRIPAWCNEPRILVNGNKIDFVVKKGFTKIERYFSDGDEISLILPSKIKVLDYHGKGNYLEKGPLVYSYGMYGKREIDKEDVNQTEEFPSYNIYPDKNWNYALCTDEKSLLEYEFIKREPNGEPWNINNVPYVIKVPAVMVND